MMSVCSYIESYESWPFLQNVYIYIHMVLGWAVGFRAIQLSVPLAWCSSKSSGIIEWMQTSIAMMVPFFVGSTIWSNQFTFLVYQLSPVGPQLPNFLCCSIESNGLFFTKSLFLAQPPLPHNWKFHLVLFQPSAKLILAEVWSRDSCGKMQRKSKYFEPWRPKSPPYILPWWCFHLFIIFSLLPGEMIQFDWYFSNGLKPPPKYTVAHCCTVFDPTTGNCTKEYINNNSNDNNNNK